MTTAQTFHTPPKQQFDQRICKTIDFRNKTGYYSPSKHKMSNQAPIQSSQRSESPRSNRSTRYDANSQASAVKNSNHKSVSHKKSNISTSGRPPRYESPAKLIQNNLNNNMQDINSLEQNSSISKSDLISVTSQSKFSNNQQIQASEFSDNKSMHSYRSYKSGHLSSGKKSQKPKICNELFIYNLA